MYKGKFDSVVDNYNNELELLEHLTNSYNISIDKLEAQGRLASTEYIKALSKVEQDNINVLNKQLNDMIYAFSEGMNSGEIEKGSDAWYQMQQSINGTKQAIDEASLSLEKYKKQMREIEWETFDFAQERISQITNESDFLIELLSGKKLVDEAGNLTKEGLSTAGLHAVNYNVYMAQADDYAKEIRKIDREMAQDPYNTDLIKRREELLELQQKSILAAEKEKNATIELVKDGLNAELDTVKSLIDAYTSTFESAKNLAEYQKKIEGKTRNIASLKKQLSAYSNDTSEENKARVQKILVDLKDAEADLRETEYEQFVSDTKRILDNLYLDYETNLNKRLDDIDGLIDDMTITINSSAAAIDETISESASGVGYTLSEAMSNIWGTEESAGKVIARYGDGFSTALTTVNTTLNTIKDKVADLKNISTTINNITNVTNPVATGSVNGSSGTTPVGNVASSVASSASSGGSSGGSGSGGSSAGSSSGGSSGGSSSSGGSNTSTYPPPKITTQPSAASVTEGEEVRLSCGAQGAGHIKYEWHYSDNGARNWYVVSNSDCISGNLTPNLRIKAKVSQSGRVFRCRVYSEYGEVYSSIVAVVVRAAAKSTSPVPQPAGLKPATTNTSSSANLSLSTLGVKTSSSNNSKPSGGGSSGGGGSSWKYNITYKGKTYSANQSQVNHSNVAAAIYTNSLASGWNNNTLKSKGFNVDLVNVYLADYKAAGQPIRMDTTKYYYNRFLKGGLVDYTGLAYVDGTPDNPELMLNAKDTSNFLSLRDTLREIGKQPVTAGSQYRFGINTLSGIRSVSSEFISNRMNAGTTIGDISITIPIDHVDNYNDFISQLQQDRKFEKFIQSMTVDRIAGGSSLAKNKFKWQ